MKPSKPEKNVETTLECFCGWSRKVSPGEDANEAARYHAIQVHNNIEATRHGKF